MLSDNTAWNPFRIRMVACLVMRVACARLFRSKPHDHRQIRVLTTCLQDNSDAQYRGFRSNAPALLGLSTVFLACKAIYSKLVTLRMSRQPTDNLHSIPFSLGFSLLMLIVLHGTSILKILAILSLNYAIVKIGRGSRLTPIITWIFNAAVLFLNETQEGYRFSAIHPSLGYLVRPLPQEHLCSHVS